MIKMFFAIDHAQEPGGCATITWIGFCLFPALSGFSGALVPKIEPRFVKDLREDESVDDNTESAISCDDDSAGLAGAVSTELGVWVVASEAASLLGVSEGDVFSGAGEVDGAFDVGAGAGAGASLVGG